MMARMPNGSAPGRVVRVGRRCASGLVVVSGAWPVLASLRGRGSRIRRNSPVTGQGHGGVYCHRNGEALPSGHREGGRMGVAIAR